MPTAALTSKGQITVPRQIRQHLGVGTGDRLDFSVADSGEVVVRPLRTSVRALAGIVTARRGTRASSAQADRRLAAALGADDLRIRRRRT